MAKKENSLAHTKWMCKYHIVFTPKYRRKVIYNQYKEDIRDIIKLRFFQGKTQMEVADEIQISQAQVSRLEKNALKTMRQYLI